MIKKLILPLFVIAAFGFSASAQSDGSVKSGDAVKSEKSRGDNPEIKTDDLNNVDGYKGKVVGPDGKGTPSRSGYCRVNFDNYTNWVIKCYVDGNFEGTVGRFGEAGVSVAPGRTKFYTVAQFTDGSNVTWGPGFEQCNAGQTFDVKLWEGQYRTSVHW